MNVNDFPPLQDKIYMNLRTSKDYKERNNVIAKEADVSLRNIKASLTDDEEKIHCENLIGAITIPVGIAGPLIIRAEDTNSSYYVPLATTEGALVASVNRGMKAIQLSDGCDVFVDYIGSTRGPVFKTSSLSHSKEFCTWLYKNKETLVKQGSQTSSHLKLIDINVDMVGDTVFVRFVYNTHDAMGMNMVTIATTKIVTYIHAHYEHVRCISIAGNYDVDKKPSWLNNIRGRGFVCDASVTVTREIIADVLKTESRCLYDTWVNKCMIGSAMAGSMGFNSHFANIVAAFFAATGQDLAHVTEGSLGITNLTHHEENDSVTISVHLPSIMLGTVGGGTSLQTQTEARSIMKANSSGQLARILAGAVLAGELSLLSSLSEGSLASAHARLGR